MKCLQVDKIAQSVLERYICKGCNREIRKTAMIIPFGPQKGKRMIAHLGCKCTDMQLAKEARNLQAKLKAKRMEERFEIDSFINRSLSEASFENYEPATQELAEAKRQLQLFAEDFNPNIGNILLVGSYGTGKSHLAVAVTKALVQQGYACLFLSVPKLMTKIKETYSNHSYSEYALLERLTKMDLLVLDDLGAEYGVGKENGNNWAQTKLFEVMDSRAGSPTIYTTNLTSKQLEQKISERNMSRLMQDTQVIKMNGPDFRRQPF